LGNKLNGSKSIKKMNNRDFLQKKDKFILSERIFWSKMKNISLWGNLSFKSPSFYFQKI